jgi:broad specificity phosphatase PhoE
MKLIITRHGETVQNKKRICQGHTHGKLSREGIMQAKKVAERLSKEKIDAIYSSDLKRAADTAKEIAKFHKLAIQFDDRLRERFFGKYQGKAIRKNWDWRTAIGKEIESDEKMEKRFTQLLKELYSKHKNKTVLVVTHGGIKKVFIDGAEKSKNDGLDADFVIKNTSISIFEIEGLSRITPKLINCTKHLDKPKKSKK